jgi:hypothetical protein
MKLNQVRMTEGGIGDLISGMLAGKRASLVQLPPALAKSEIAQKILKSAENSDGPLMDNDHWWNWVANKFIRYLVPPGSDQPVTTASELIRLVKDKTTKEIGGWINAQAEHHGNEMPFRNKLDTAKRASERLQKLLAVLTKGDPAKKPQALQIIRDLVAQRAKLHQRKVVKTEGLNDFMSNAIDMSNSWQRNHMGNRKLMAGHNKLIATVALKITYELVKKVANNLQKQTPAAKQTTKQTASQNKTKPMISPGHNRETIANSRNNIDTELD